MNKYIIHLYVVEFYDPNSAVTLESFVHDFQQTGVTGVDPYKRPPGQNFTKIKTSPTPLLGGSKSNKALVKEFQRNEILKKQYKNSLSLTYF